MRAGGRSSSKSPDASRSQTRSTVRAPAPSRWPAVEGPTHERAHPLLGVEQAPRAASGRCVCGCRPIQASPRPAGRWGPEGRGARVVGDGEAPPEGLRGLGGGAAGLEGASSSMWSGPTSQTSTTRAPPSGCACAEPAQAGSLGLEEAGGGVGPRLAVVGGGARHGDHASCLRSGRSGACDRPGEALACRASASRYPSDVQSGHARRAGGPMSGATPPPDGPLTLLDLVAVRRWAVLTRSLFAARRVEIDALNVFPVPDGDTGTNLYLTFDGAVERTLGHRRRHDRRRAARGLRQAPAVDRPGQLRGHPQPAGPRPRRGLRRCRRRSTAASSPRDCATPRSARARP